VGKPKLYITLFLMILMPLIILVTAVLYPSGGRKEEIAKEKEIEITDRFIAGYTLTEDEINYLHKRNFKYLINGMRIVLQKDKGKGYELYKRAINMGVESQQIYTELAQLYINRNEKDKAIALYEKAIALDPDVKNWPTKGYIKKLADMYYASGDCYRASKLYEKYLTYYRRSIPDMYSLSVCYIKMRETDKALSLLNNCIKIDPGNKFLTDIYNLMGLIYEGKGIMVEAQNYYTESLRINPNNKKAETNLKRVEKKLKEQKI